MVHSDSLFLLVVSCGVCRVLYLDLRFLIHNFLQVQRPWIPCEKTSSADNLDIVWWSSLCSLSLSTVHCSSLSSSVSLGHRHWNNSCQDNLGNSDQSYSLLDLLDPDCRDVCHCCRNVQCNDSIGS